VVRGYISLILEGKIGPGENQVRDALQVADKRARHLQHLIEELLDLSRIEAGKLSIKQEDLDARKHIAETLEMFRDDLEQRDLSVNLNIPENLPAVCADHDKLHQVFTNLVSNAIPEGL
jgi:signal transduction histidine kinase